MMQDQTIPMAPQGVFPAQLTLAMAYVPYQAWEQTLPPDEALCEGTVFPSLVKPFMKEKGGVQYEEAAAVFGRDAKG